MVKNKAAVIWLTGLPASGKTTIAVGLQSLLLMRDCRVFVLDGDRIRKGLNRDLGFSPQDRTENIRRIGEVAKLFMDAGFIIITAFISPYKKDRDLVRRLFSQGEFIEVHINASLKECEKRDPKGLYAKARKGEIREFTGITAPYEEPINPEIVINTEESKAQECISKLLQYLEKNGYVARQ